MTGAAGNRLVAIWVGARDRARASAFKAQCETWIEGTRSDGGVSSSCNFQPMSTLEVVFVKEHRPWVVSATPRKCAHSSLVQHHLQNMHGTVLSSNPSTVRLRTLGNILATLGVLRRSALQHASVRCFAQ
jgi:hypothetical protein